jgi:uncharacterized protein (TIGR02001 family)
MKFGLFRSAAAAAALATGLIGLAAPASAQSDIDVAFNAGIVTDYVFRGFSQTSEDPAIQGGVDITSGSFYAGAWASNVDFGDATDAEIDIYGGYRTEAAGFALDFGVIGYLYPGEPDGADYNYAEFKAAASRAVGPATVGAAVYYSPDFFGADEAATYAEINGAFSPADKWTISGAVGQQWLDVTDDYVTWNAGVAYALTDNLALDVRYHDTDVDGVPGAEDRVVGSVKLVF